MDDPSVAIKGAITDLLQMIGECLGLIYHFCTLTSRRYVEPIERLDV